MTVKLLFCNVKLALWRNASKRQKGDFGMIDAWSSRISWEKDHTREILCINYHSLQIQMLSKHDFVLSCMKSTFSHLFLSLFKDCFDILQRVVPNKIRCSFASHFFRENRQDIFTWKDVCSVCRWRCFRLLSAPTAFVVSGQSQTMLFEKNRPKLTKSYRWLHKDFFCVSQVLLRSNLETADFRKETFCEILKTENIEEKDFFLGNCEN